MAADLRPAVFLDRDGVLNKDLGYVHRPEDLELLPGVAQSLATLRARGFLLIVVSNQSGVARGFYTTAAVDLFHSLMNQQLGAEGAAIDRFYYCPHHLDGTVADFTAPCLCRKPSPGMVLQAAAELAIDLQRSYLVGDRFDDIECAVRAGIRGIQVESRNSLAHPAAMALVASLHEAVPLLKLEKHVNHSSDEP